MELAYSIGGRIKRLIVAVLAAMIMTTGYGSGTARADANSCPQWHNKLKQYGLPVAEFSRIMYRESRCEPKVIGWNYRAGTSYKDCKLSPASTYKRCKAVRSYDSGLLQVNSGWVTLTAQTCQSALGDLTVLLQPDCNLAVSGAIYKGSGIGNWRATSGKG